MRSWVCEVSLYFDFHQFAVWCFKTITFREALFRVLWKDCLPGSLLSFIFSASKVMVARLTSFLFMDCIAIAQYCFQSGRTPVELGPTLSAQTYTHRLCLHFSLHAGWARAGIECQVQSEHLRQTETLELAPSFQWIYLGCRPSLSRPILDPQPKAPAATLDNILCSRHGNIWLNQCWAPDPRWLIRSSFSKIWNRD